MPRLACILVFISAILAMARSRSCPVRGYPALTGRRFAGPGNTTRMLVLFCFATPTLAQDLQLRLPLDCTLGDDCFVQQYVDADPGPGARDFTGGPLTYDGHKGTDIRVADDETMKAGIPILAPAAGRVIGVRDGTPDGTRVAGQDCGNGVVIDHGGGWQTQLCHLANGSVTTARGNTVTEGQPLALMGRTGQTEFPHVHIAVRRDGAVVDPFVEALWREAPIYEAGGLLAAGFSDAIPEYDAVKAGTADAANLPVDAPALVLWGSIYGSQAGDVLRLTIRGPRGKEILSQDVALDRTQAQAFRAVGRRLNATRWQGGRYVGVVVLFRGEAELDRIETQVMLD